MSDSDEDRDPVLQAAYARGRAALVRRLELEGGSLSTSEVAQQVGATEDDVIRGLSFCRLLGIKMGDGLAFPRWQFQPDGQPFPMVQKLLPALGRTQFLIFMLSPHPALTDGRRPLDLMRAGEDKLLQELASVSGEHVSW